MTLETYWVINDNKMDQPNSPLITKWIKLLSLESEPIKIITEHKDGYAGIKLIFNNYANSWFIINNGLDDYHLIHKLGYIWFWKRMGYLEYKKSTWNDQTNLYCLTESCIMDNIVFYYFCNMDQGFNEFWLNFTIEECKHWYNGGSWYKPLPNMLYQYIVNYLNYFYVVPEELQNELSNYILYELDIRRSEILEKSENNHVKFTKKDFIYLHKILRKFNTILGSKDYKNIETYIFQLHDIFNKL